MPDPVVCPACQGSRIKRLMDEDKIGSDKKMKGYCEDCGALFYFYSQELINVPREGL